LRRLGLGKWWENGGKMAGKWGFTAMIMGIYGTGWWLTYPSEKYEFVSWDDSSQDMEK